MPGTDRPEPAPNGPAPGADGAVPTLDAAIASPDGGLPRPDAGAAPDSTVPGCSGDEVCNGVDDDCDGIIDEASAFSRCQLEHASAMCTAGACVVATCDEGFADCDGLSSTGCETSTRSLDHCGGCAGSADQAVCSGLPHVVTSDCSTGACAISACEFLWANCDGDNENGCERNTSLEGVCAPGRKRIVIDPRPIDAELTGFPVLVRLSDFQLSTARADARDLFFTTTGDEADTLPFELEAWNRATGDLVAWVGLPSVSSSAETVFYLHFGDGLDHAAANPPSAVWSSDFRAVYHFQGGLDDATENKIDGVDHGTNADPLGAIAGARGLAADAYADMGTGRLPDQRYYTLSAYKGVVEEMNTRTNPILRRRCTWALPMMMAACCSLSACSEGVGTTRPGLGEGDPTTCSSMDSLCMCVGNADEGKNGCGQPCSCAPAPSDFGNSQEAVDTTVDGSDAAVAPTRGRCEPGLYLGQYDCEVNIFGIPFPLTGDVSFNLTVDEEVMRAERCQEFCDLVIAKGTGVMFGFAGGFGFEAQLEGGLDCQSGVFHASAPTGIYGTPISSDPNDPDALWTVQQPPFSTFKGMLDGMHETDPPQQIAGDWTLVDDLTGISCVGPFSVELQP